MRLLAATDGSHYSQAAVRCAAWLASRLSASRLDIVLVGDAEASLLESPVLRARTVRTMRDAYRRWARTALSQGVREAARFRVVARPHYVKARSLEPIARAIDRAASSLGADLVVVGTHGRGVVRTALLGSVARRLVSTARVPVLVVPAPFSRPAPGALRIAAATDGSRVSARAIQAAAGLVRRARGGVLEIVTVATLRTDLSLGFSSAALAFLPFADLAESERRAALRILGAGKRVARRARIHPELRFLERGKRERVAEALARWAVRRRFHLLAIGREGRTAFEDWTVGSVTRRVLSVSRRPVLVVGRRHP